GHKRGALSYAKHELGLRYPALCDFGCDAGGAAGKFGVRCSASAETDSWPKRRWNLEGRIGEPTGAIFIDVFIGHGFAYSARQTGQYRGENFFRRVPHTLPTLFRHSRGHDRSGVSVAPS